MPNKRCTRLSTIVLDHPQLALLPTLRTHAPLFIPVLNTHRDSIVYGENVIKGNSKRETLQ